MYLAITILAFVLTNIGILTYAHVSAKSSFHFLLLPALFFPLLYVINASFSVAFLAGQRAQIGIALLLFLNIAVNVTLSLLGNAFVWKESIALAQWIGIALIVCGASLVVFKA